MTIPYQQSRDIEQRLDQILDLICSDHYCTRSLAEVLNVSQPTVSRCITALRDRGHAIRSVRDEDGWHYELVDKPSQTTKPRRNPA
ncbi:MAG: transcriptional regulator [Phycisphaeraceae bacterium]|nr:transcriptional regulator [Phycisphaeraceae bacterium]